jgi:hypothetical protein
MLGTYIFVPSKDRIKGLIAHIDGLRNTAVRVEFEQGMGVTVCHPDSGSIIEQS